VERDVRALVGYLTSLTVWPIRDKFARLSEMATLLSLEKVRSLLQGQKVRSLLKGQKVRSLLQGKKVRSLLQGQKVRSLLQGQKGSGNAMLVLVQYWVKGEQLTQTACGLLVVAISWHVFAL